MGGAERNARKKKQQNLQAAKAVAAARGSNDDRTKVLIGVVAVVVLAAAVIGGVVLSKNSGGEPTLTPVAGKTVTTAPSTRDGGVVVVGEESAEVTVDVYEDFLCPFCGEFERTYGDQIKEQLDAGTVRVRYHTLPMLNSYSSPEGYSTDSANAALCAADEGKFPAYHESLYAQQPEEGDAGYTKQELIKLGTDLGITGDAFASCVNGDEHVAEAQQELADAKSTPHLQVDRNGQKGFRGTPSISVGDRVLDVNDENWLKNLVGSTG
ncbi:DsbA family protein [Umezawaea beigongshangensis]|uniref:DsbA family protein n=1 Tax=Umezawaea beigongshangensis TaxID=2780383 RepID=UPI0018F20B1B|nr:thioredoxin domain-containing protein [Umezawaea beigongshangensis]